MKHQRGLLFFKQTVRFQILLQAVISLALYLSAGVQACVAFGLGGLVNVIPNACFAVMHFRRSGALATKEILKGFYKGEALKLGLTAWIFAILFKFTQVKAMYVFLGFTVAQLSFILRAAII